MASIPRVGKINHKHKKGVPEIILDLFGDQRNISDSFGIVRYLYIEKHIQGLGSSFQVRGAADAAYTRCNDQPIQNCPSYEQIFEPPIHGPGTPGVGYHTIFDFNKDFQISFDPVEGIDMYFFIAHLITFNGIH
jgi:hypothetical protein